jgi:hypothetical protein
LMDADPAHVLALMDADPAHVLALMDADPAHVFRSLLLFRRRRGRG